MIFSSLEFMCVFLPVVFLTYCIVPGLHCKNALLIAASLLFYAYGEPQYVALMVFSACFNYIFARMIEGFKQKKCLLVLNVMVNLGMLLFFKYMAFFLETWNKVTGMEAKIITVDLPIGISFFTFQALSYVADVYRGKVPAQKSFWKVLLYLSFFPQLIAGPIVKYRDINQALTERNMDSRQIAEGMRRFICGLGKKVLIANTAGQAADAVFGAAQGDVNSLTAWIGAVAYMMQIYYDFSGYSDMAIGLGNMFGFTFRENFRYPYEAASVREFWRRWHISLSEWFREYLYIPLGGNQKGRFRTAVNKFIVFFCTGFWHGANWTFILWGLFHGFFSVLEDCIPFFKKLPKPITYVYTMLVVCVGFVMFRAENVGQGIFMVQQMFSGDFVTERGVILAMGQLTPWFAAVMAAGLIGMAPVRPLVERIRKVVCKETVQVTWKYRVVQTGLYVGAVTLLSWCMIRLSGNLYNPFIYFRF